MYISMKTPFSKGLVSMIAAKILKKKLGINAKITLGDLELMERDDGCVHIKLKVEAVVRKDEISKLAEEFF